MAVWVGLGQAATVAQLVGVDAGGLIAKVLQAAATARENKRECEQLARRVLVIADLLQRLQDPDQAIMAGPLAGLDGALRDAHRLVASCQRRSAAYRFVMAGRQAERFRRVQGRIDSYLALFPVINCIAMAGRLDRMYSVVLSLHTIINVPPPSQLEQHQTGRALPETSRLDNGADEFTFPLIAAPPPAIDTMLGCQSWCLF